MSVDKVSSQPTLHTLESAKVFGETIKIEGNNEEIEPKKPATKEEVEQVVMSMNDFLEPSNIHIKFELHEKLNEYYVTLVDNETSEVVREIPSKKILDVYSAMTEFIGLLFDKKI